MDPSIPFHRVDAARRLMSIPNRAAEGSGRLHMAKMVHEAAKRGDVDLDAILETVLAQLEKPNVRAGAEAEHAWFVENA